MTRRLAAKVDRNQPEIVAALRQLGCSREGAARYERTNAILARERRRGFLARWWGRA